MDFDNSLLDEFKIDIKIIIPKILEAIVKIYGEKHRLQIEKMLNTIVINTYITFEDVQFYFLSKKWNFIDFLTIKLLKKLEFNITPEIEDKVYKGENFLLKDEHKIFLDMIQANGIVDKMIEHKRLMNVKTKEQKKGEDR